MFSQHPFTLGHRYSLDAAHALPTWKRLLDLICCIAALPLLGFLTFVFMLLAKLSSRGPVFYRQRHAGCMGRSFGAYRFRTMRTAPRAATPDHRVHSLLIPGGRFLRSSGLADLPQIVNVLRGEMSFVGPRPCDELPDGPRAAGQRVDLFVVPGVTGAWRLARNNPAQREATAQWEQTYP